MFQHRVKETDMQFLLHTYSPLTTSANAIPWQDYIGESYAGAPELIWYNSGPCQQKQANTNLATGLYQAMHFS